ncbi:MAG: ExbD/TolR family protein [Fusobacteriaceae bacterium]
MKLERSKRRKSGELVLELTPLIDVVFLLLIFFLVATSFEDTKSGVKIDVPASSMKELTEVKDLQITITSKKEIALIFQEGGKSVTKNIDAKGLKTLLMTKLENNEKKNVLISADKSLDYGYIMNIMTIAKESGAIALDLDTTSLSRKK